LGFNEPVSAQAFPIWALTNQFPLVKAQTGTGQTDFRKAVPNWAKGVNYSPLGKPSVIFRAFAFSGLFHYPLFKTFSVHLCFKNEKHT